MAVLNGVHGTPQAWVAVDAEEDAICGAAAAFPRRFHLGNEGVLRLGPGGILFKSSVSELRSGTSVAAGVLGSGGTKLGGFLL